MKKTTLPALVLLLIFSVMAVQVSAQGKPVKKVRMGLGLETGLPVGQFGNAYNFGAGASFRMAVSLSEDAAITGSAGAMAFIPKEIAGVDLKAQLNIPLKAGFKYMLSKNFYTLAEAGATIARVYYPTMSGKLESISSTRFTYAANVGTQLGKFDASIRYESFSSTGFVGARIGFNF